MTELTPRERRQQRTRQAILDAARQIISTKGLDALSIRAIADAIDYSPAGLYEYFGSKEEIIAAVCEEGFRRFTNHLKLVDEQLPADEYMVELGMAYIDFAVRNPDFFLLMFTTVPMGLVSFSTGDKLDQADLINDDSSFGMLLRAVQRGMNEGVLYPPSDMGLLELAYAAWTQVHGMAMLRISPMTKRMPIDYAQADRAALHALHLGFRPQ